MGPRSGWRSQPDPSPGTVDDHREADRLLQRYGGRAGGHLRYRRATPQQGTRPLPLLGAVEVAYREQMCDGRSLCIVPDPEILDKVRGFRRLVRWAAPLGRGPPARDHLV